MYVCILWNSPSRNWRDLRNTITRFANRVLPHDYNHACAINPCHKVFSFASRNLCDCSVRLLSLEPLSTLLPTKYTQVKLYFPSNNCTEQVEGKSSVSLLCLQCRALLSHKVQEDGDAWIRAQREGDWWNWDRPDKKTGSREWWQNGEGEAGEAGFRD